MKDPDHSEKIKKRTVNDALSSKGSNALSESATSEKEEAFGSPSGSDPDPNFGEKKTAKPKKKKGEDFLDSEILKRWEKLKVQDEITFLIRDSSGQQISSRGEIEQIFRDGERKAIHVRNEQGMVHICVSPDEVTSVKKNKTLTATKAVKEILDRQPILPGTINLADAIVEMVSRRNTWEESLSELESFDSLLSEQRKELKDLRSKVRECRKLYVTSKRTAKSLGAEIP